MIDAALTFLTATVRGALGLGTQEVVLRPARALADPAAPEGVSLSLVNVREERILRNLPHVERTQTLTRYVEPPAYVNLDVLVAVNFADHAAGLRHLSRIIELFQGHRYFDAQTPGPADAGGFPAGLARLILEMRNLDAEDLRNLWGMLGAPYLPSVLYKTRLVELRSDRQAPAERIETIRLTSRISPVPLHPGPDDPD